MFNPQRVLVICKVSSAYQEFSNLEVEYLFRTLIKFGDRLSNCKKLAYFNDGAIDQNISKKLTDLGVGVRYIKPLDDDTYPFYKTSLLDAVEIEDFDILIMLDSDIVVADDFSDQIEKDFIKAKPVDTDPFSLDQWKELFNYFNLELPKERYYTSVRHDTTIPYFNAGVLFIPKKYMQTLNEKWKKFGKFLFTANDLPANMNKHIRYFEQISLALALADSKLPHKPLSLDMNYPFIGHVHPSENPETIKPHLIHHHHCITEKGKLMHCPYENINQIIDQMNHYLTKDNEFEITDNNIKNSNFAIQNLVHLGDYQEVVRRMSKLPIDSDDGEKQYYLALSLHITDQNLEEALIRYTTALDSGYYFWRFSPFWIYYNRGLLHFRLNNIKKAEEDLKKANSLDPNHQGVKDVLTLIEKKKNC